MPQLNDIVWAKSDDGFWPGVIVRQKMSNLRIWKFSGRIHVRYFQKTRKAGQVLASWIKEEDLVPFEILPGPSVFQDLSLQEAYTAALRHCKISGFVPEFARDQVISSQKMITMAKSLEKVREVQKVKTPNGTNSIEGPVKIPNIFSSTKLEIKDEGVETPIMPFSETTGWPMLLSSTRSSAESKQKQLSREAKTPNSLKRKREEEKENDIADATPRTSAKMRRTFGKNNYLAVEDITEEMLAGIPTRVKDKRKPVTEDDKARSVTCHQCRQKTMDLKTLCRVAGREGHGTGSLCGICLKNIYGQDIRIVLKDPKWMCPSCQGKCICSICMKKKGLEPNGALSQEAKNLGFNSVTDYIASGKKALKEI